MSTDNDGGPAFPHGPLGDSIHGEDGMVRHQWPGGAGMSLRDWFVGQALVGILSNYDLVTDIDVRSQKSTRDAVADYAVAVADSVLKAREQ